MTELQEELYDQIKSKKNPSIIFTVNKNNKIYRYINGLEFIEEPTVSSIAVKNNILKKIKQIIFIDDKKIKMNIFIEIFKLLDKHNNKYGFLLLENKKFKNVIRTKLIELYHDTKNKEFYTLFRRLFKKRIPIM